MEDARNKLLYPLLLVAAFSLTLFGLFSIALISGKMPTAHSGAVDAVVGSERARHAAESDQTAARCSDCAVVTSIRALVPRGGSGDPPARRKAVAEVRFRMADGSLHTSVQSIRSGLAVGDTVRIENGALARPMEIAGD